MAGRADVLVKAFSNRFSELQKIRTFVETNIGLYESDLQEFNKKTNAFLNTLQNKTPEVKSIVIVPHGGQQYFLPIGKVNPQEERAFNKIVLSKVEKIKKSNKLNNYTELRTVARLAIYQDDLFWGTVAMALDVMPILSKANLINSKSGLFKFSLRVKGGDVFYGSEFGFTGNPMVYNFSMPNNQWEVSITPLVTNHKFNANLWLAFNFLIAGLGSFLLIKFLVRKENFKMSNLNKVTSITQEKFDLSSVLNALPDLYFRTTRNGTIIDHQINQPGTFHITSEQCKNLKIQDVLPRQFGRVFLKKWNNSV